MIVNNKYSVFVFFFAAAALCPIPLSAAKKPGLITTQSGLRLRVAASTDAKVLLTIPPNAKISFENKAVLSDTRDIWLAVIYSGRKGYVAAEYVKAIIDCKSRTGYLACILAEISTNAEIDEAKTHLHVIETGKNKLLLTLPKESLRQIHWLPSGELKITTGNADGDSISWQIYTYLPPAKEITEQFRVLQADLFSVNTGSICEPEPRCLCYQEFIYTNNRRYVIVNIDGRFQIFRVLADDWALVRNGEKTCYQFDSRGLKAIADLGPDPVKYEMHSFGHVLLASKNRKMVLNSHEDRVTSAP